MIKFDIIYALFQGDYVFFPIITIFFKDLAGLSVLYHHFDGKDSTELHYLYLCNNQPLG